MKTWWTWCIIVVFYSANNSFAIEIQTISLPLPNEQHYCNHVIDRSETNLVVCSYDPHTTIRYLTWYELTSAATPIQRGHIIPLPADVVALTLADVLPDAGPELMYITANKAVAVTQAFDQSPTYTVLATVTTLWAISEPGHIEVIPPATHTMETKVGDVVIIPEPMGVAVITPPAPTQPRQCHHLRVKPDINKKPMSGVRTSFRNSMRKFKGFGLRSHDEPDRIEFSVSSPVSWLEREPNTDHFKVIAWSGTTWWMWTFTDKEVPIASTIKLPISLKDDGTPMDAYSGAIAHDDTWWCVGHQEKENETKGYLALWRRQNDEVLTSDLVGQFSALSSSPLTGDFNNDGFDDIIIITDPLDEDERGKKHVIKVYLWQPTKKTFSPSPWASWEIEVGERKRFGPPKKEAIFAAAFPAYGQNKDPLWIHQEKERLIGAHIQIKNDAGSLANHETLLKINSSARCAVVSMSRREVVVVNDTVLQWCRLP